LSDMSVILLGSTLRCLASLPDIETRRDVKEKA
jgi:hypothetical protein